MGFWLLCYNRKIVSIEMHKNLGIGFSRPRLLFYFTFWISSSFILFKKVFCFFLAKKDRGYDVLSYETSVGKIQDICWQKTKIFQKNVRQKTFFLWKFQNFGKFFDFFLKKTCSDENLLKTLFVEIGWGFSKIFDFEYIFGWNFYQSAFSY